MLNRLLILGGRRGQLNIVLKAVGVSKNRKKPSKNIQNIESCCTQKGEYQATRGQV